MVAKMTRKDERARGWIMVGWISEYICEYEKQRDDSSSDIPRIPLVLEKERQMNDLTTKK